MSEYITNKDGEIIYGIMLYPREVPITLRCYSTGGSSSPVVTANVGLTGVISTVARNGSNIATITTTANHGLTTGDVITVVCTSDAGFNAVQTAVTVTGLTTFTIPWNTNQSNYTALSGSPAGAYWRKVLYPFNYSPGVSFINAVTVGTTTTVVTTTV